MTQRVVTKPKPERCDICKGPIRLVFYDAMTISGKWGDLCPLCYDAHTYRRLGTGFGQRFEFVAEGQPFKKTGG